MSSLAATQADGYYAPPEYYESGAYKKKSVSQFNEKNSKGHNQYLQQGVVRFELPYDGFCQECGEHVGKGTRFNAKKTKSGNYFSSPIYQFRMSCRVCSKVEFVIQTNPKERSFDYLEGIHKQVQEFDTKEAGTAGVIDTDYGNKLVPTTSQADDGPLSRMESVASGARKTMTEREQLESLMHVNNRTFSNDAGSNASIRSTFRADRNKRKRRLRDGQALGWKEMELAEETIEDVASARSTCFGKGTVIEKNKFRNLRTSSIFDGRAGKRKRKTERRAIDDGLPDDVRSLSSSSVSQNAVPVTASSGVVVKQEEACADTEKKRIRLVPSGAKLERQDETAAPSTTTKDSSLALLLDGYGSDSD